LVLDVKTVAVGGTITLNGAGPALGSYCTSTPSSGSPADVTFTETTTGYNFSFGVPCASSTFTWSGVVYPGTYRVSVMGRGPVWSNLPNASGYVVNAALAVTAAASNLVLDVKTVSVDGTVTLNGAGPTLGSYCPVTATASNLVLDVKTASVGGTVTLNGAVPTLGSYCTSSPSSGSSADVAFTETTTGYNFSFGVPCSSSTFAWSGVLYPGTYRVSVMGRGPVWSNLPDASGYVVVPRIAVP
jgi:hypothetical protein